MSILPSAILVFQIEIPKKNETKRIICLDKLSASIKQDGVILPEPLKCLAYIGIQNVCVSQKYMAFHLSDGRIARIAYSVQPHLTDGNTELQEPPVPISLRMSNKLTNKDRDTPVPPNEPEQPSDESRNNQGSQIISRAMRRLAFLREMRRNGLYLFREDSQSTGRLDVPEALVEQAMTVLQGKSREVIVRELQRTNLDVNMAVNNLLSRDDDSDDALSDSLGLSEDQSEMFDFDLFPVFENVVDQPVRTNPNVVESTATRERKLFRSGLEARSTKVLQFAQEQIRSQKRLLGLDDTSGTSSSQSTSKVATDKDNLASANNTKNECALPIEFGDQLEFWCNMELPDRPELRFSQMGSMFSELVAIRVTGELCQWRWKDVEPFLAMAANERSYYHPRCLDLGLISPSESIVQLACSLLRSTVLTNDGRVATWMDEEIAPIGGNKLEHTVTSFPDSLSGSDRMIHISVSSFITCALTKYGKLHYWGMTPPSLNASRQVPQAPSGETSDLKNNASAVGGGNSTKANTVDQQNTSLNLVPGMFVSTKSAPLYHAGAIGVTIKNGEPILGVLQEDVWEEQSVCRFRIRTCEQILAERGNGLLLSTSSSSTHALFDPLLHSQVCPALLLQQQTQTATSTASFMYTLRVNPDATGSISRGPSSVCGGSEVGDQSVPNYKNEMMPPPPSPASSTCSDQSGYVKRKRANTSSASGSNIVNTQRLPNTEREQREASPSCPLYTKKQAHSSSCNPIVYVAEEWRLADVIFLEDGRSQPVGLVLKVDSGAAAVKFLKEGERACLLTGCPMAPPVGLQLFQRLSDSESTCGMSSPLYPPGRVVTAQENLDWFNDIRLIRKEELVAIRSIAMRTFHKIQEKASLVANLSENDILAMCNTNDAIHVISRSSSLKGVSLQSVRLDGHLLRSHLLMNFMDDPHLHITSGTTPTRSVHLKCLEPLNGLYHNSSQNLPEYIWDRNGCLYPYLSPNSPSDVISLPSKWPDLLPLKTMDSIMVTVPHSFNSELSTQNACRRSTNFDIMPPCFLKVIVMEWHLLLPSILRSDSKMVISVLYRLRNRFMSPDTSSTNSENGSVPISQTLPHLIKHQVMKECIDGGRNLIHAAVSMCAPASNKEADWSDAIMEVLQPSLNDSNLELCKPSSSMEVGPEWFNQFTSSSLRDLYDQEFNNDQSSMSTAEESSFVNTSPWLVPPVTIDTKEKRLKAHFILRYLLDSQYSIFTISDLLTLLNQQDCLGQTPFQLAIHLKAYPAAYFILGIVFKMQRHLQPDWDLQNGIISSDASLSRHSGSGSGSGPGSTSSTTSTMLFPENAGPDDSPLVRLCYNDPCTFVWTGKSHICQDVFECRTCGLTDPLCCCLECARVCHRGHDCRLKRRSSPNAYCDCWQNSPSPCSSLIEGDKRLRLLLFDTLLKRTDLANLPNGSGEHVLTYLVGAHERLLRESRTLNRKQRGKVHELLSGKDSGLRHTVHDVASLEQKTNARIRTVPKVPEHGFPPPAFSREAIDMCLQFSPVLKSLLTCGLRSRMLEEMDVPLDGKNVKRLSKDKVVLLHQSSSHELDKVVYGIVTKLSDPLKSIDILLRSVRTLCTNSSNRLLTSEHANPVNRLCRSVLRVYTCLAAVEEWNTKKASSSDQDVPRRRRSNYLINRTTRPDPIKLCYSILHAFPKQSVKVLAQKISSLTNTLKFGIHQFDIRSMKNMDNGSNLMSVLASAAEKNETDLQTAMDALFFDFLPNNFTEEVASRWDVPPSQEDFVPEDLRLSDSGTNTTLGLPVISRMRDLTDATIATTSHSSTGISSETRHIAHSHVSHLPVLTPVPLPSLPGDAHSHHHTTISHHSLHSPSSNSELDSAVASELIRDEEPTNTRNESNLVAWRRLLRRLDPNSDTSSASSSNSDNDDDLMIDDNVADNGNFNRSTVASIPAATLLTNLDQIPHSEGSSQGLTSDMEIDRPLEPIPMPERINERERDDEDVDDNARDVASAEEGEDDDTHEEEEEEEEDESYTIVRLDNMQRGMMINSYDNESSGDSDIEMAMINEFYVNHGDNNREEQETNVYVPRVSWQTYETQARDPSPKRDSTKPLTKLTLLEASKWILKTQRETTRPGRMNKNSESSSKNIYIPVDKIMMKQVTFAKTIANLLRLCANLMFSIDKKNSSLWPSTSTSSQEKCGIRLVNYVGKRLQNLWHWLTCVMDPLEAQLKYAVARLQTNKYEHELSICGSSSWNRSGRSLTNQQECLSYVLSIMRGNSDEHGDSIFNMDLTNLHSQVHIYDGMMYLIKMCEDFVDKGHLSTRKYPSIPPAIPNPGERMEGEPSCSSQPSGSAKDQDKSSNTVGETGHGSSLTDFTDDTNRFFRRSDSVISLNSTPVDSVLTKVPIAFPLAVRPHLLQMYSRRSELFGGAQTMGNDYTFHGLHRNLNAAYPLHFGLHSQWPSTCTTKKGNIRFDHEEKIIAEAATFLGSIKSTALNLRWVYTLAVFSRYYDSHFSSKRGKKSVLELGGFPLKQTRFQHEMEQLLSMAKFDLVLKVERERNSLLQKTCREFNQLYAARMRERLEKCRVVTDLRPTYAASSVGLQPRHLDGIGGSGSFTTPNDTFNENNLPLLCCSRMKVSFRNESGEGNGVMRGFFTAFAQAVLSEEPLTFLVALTEDEAREQEMMLSRSTVSNYLFHRFRSRHLQPTQLVVPHQLSSNNVTMSSLSSSVASAERVLPQFQLSSSSPVLESSSSSFTSRDTSVTISRNVLRDLISNLAATSLPSPNPPVEIHPLLQGPLNRILNDRPLLAYQINHFFTQLPPSVLSSFSSQEGLCERWIEEVMEIFQMNQTSSGDLPSPSPQAARSVSSPLLLHYQQPRPAPLSAPSTEESQPSLFHLNEARNVLFGWLNRQPLPPSVETSKVNVESHSIGSETSSIGVMTDETSATLIAAASVPLFWQPGIMGYYTPRVPKEGLCYNSLEMRGRVCVYRNIGRVLGLCLLMGQIMPLPLIRPVLKFILGRPLRWHDLAFFDHTTYESLRQLLEAANSNDGKAFIDSCSLTFAFTPSIQEGLRQDGRQLRELVEGGAEMPVTVHNVRHYVHLYAKARMRDIILTPLENLRQGVLDVLPASCLEGLTAEDLRLLLNGQGDVDVDQLMLFTSFIDESGCRPPKAEQIAKIKKWFWQAVRNMDQKQRQDLVYFWTSSPSLPYSGAAFSPPPTVMLRPADDNRLPSANTCVYRIYLPLYSSKRILQERLLEAIQVKDFGFV